MSEHQVHADVAAAAERVSQCQESRSSHGVAGEVAGIGNDDADRPPDHLRERVRAAISTMKTAARIAPAA